MFILGICIGAAFAPQVIYVYNYLKPIVINKLEKFKK